VLRILSVERGRRAMPAVVAVTEHLSSAGEPTLVVPMPGRSSIRASLRPVSERLAVDQERL
jgi:hypothetical protein